MSDDRRLQYDDLIATMNGETSGSDGRPASKPSSSPPLPATRLSWTQTLREYRHNRCLMTPVTSLLFLTVGFLSFIGLLLNIPQFVLGFFLSPLLRRGTWFIEFLYPFGIARWGHFKLIQWASRGQKNKSRGSGSKALKGHSRTIEQRVEVVKGRVYVHPIPQLLDNIGYLIVCCPPAARESATGKNRGDEDDGGVEMQRMRTIVSSNKDSGDKRQNIITVSNPNDSHATPSDDAPVVALIVDCGDAKETLTHVDLIGTTHYPGQTIEIHGVLCTHKHHDHTAGIAELLRHETVGRTLLNIYGGAIERVPQCNRYVANGDYITLPCVGTNDMNEVADIEVIAVPSHTRGSVVYALRNKFAPVGRTKTNQWEREEGEALVAHLFTGDTIFSCGSGVPFEADIEFPRDKNISKKRSTSLVKAGAGQNSIERCFAEVLIRALGGTFALPDGSALTKSTERMLLFPGHEYTTDLLMRQFDPNNDYSGPWTKLPPSIFFETASQYLVSSHRRTLPKSGRLLTIPAPLSRELVINPHFRSLRKRGEHILHAVRLWYSHGAKGSIEDKNGCNQVDNGNGRNKLSILVRPSSSSLGGSLQRTTSSSISEKTPSTASTWNIDRTVVNQSVFTTVYTQDIDSIIMDLQAGSVTPGEAAQRLADMKRRLNEPVVVRRPVPGTLPSEKNMYLGIVALVMLGSPPTGMNVSDSEYMNLARPVDTSDQILISKSRLISMLNLLGLISPDAMEEDRQLLEMIHLLWQEARLDDEVRLMDDDASGVEATSQSSTSLEQPLPSNLTQINQRPAVTVNYHALDAKSMANKSVMVEEGRKHIDKDEIELGLLKHALYGVSLNQPSWFSKLCRPCKKPTEDGDSWTVKSKMRRTNGELVRHDIATCPMCSNFVGCPTSTEAVACAEYRRDSMHGAPARPLSNKENMLSAKSHFNPIENDVAESPEESDYDGVEMEVIDPERLNSALGSHLSEA